MKKTVWRPVALGVVMGLLAGIATVTRLSFLSSGADIDNAIGFYMTLLLIAAALGGPLAGVLASSLFITLSALYGPPEMKAVLGEPGIFWSNMLVIGILMVLVGFAYRLIFERIKMPARLLLWMGIVISVYLLSSPANVILQSYFLGDMANLTHVLFSYKSYIPQAFFDILITSMVFLALPARYRRPLWTQH